MDAGKITESKGAKGVGFIGDSVHTTNISPAGSIKKDSPSPASFSIANGVPGPRTSTATARRRGNDRVMTRGHVRQLCASRKPDVPASKAA